MLGPHNAQYSFFLTGCHGVLSKTSYLTFEGGKQHGRETSERIGPAIWGKFYLQDKHRLFT